jgi:hypothetical protein
MDLCAADPASGPKKMEIKGMLKAGEVVQFNGEVAGNVNLVNFSLPEDGFVWSNNFWAEILFDAEVAQPSRSKSGLKLNLELDVFRFAPALIGQNVFVYFNGLRVRSIFVTERITLSIPIGHIPMLRTENIITFDLPNATVPEEFGVSDERMLGIQLFSISISN